MRADSGSRNWEIAGALRVRGVEVKRGTAEELTGLRSCLTQHEIARWFYLPLIRAVAIEYLQARRWGSKCSFPVTAFSCFGRRLCLPVNSTNQWHGVLAVRCAGWGAAFRSTTLDCVSLPETSSLGSDLGPVAWSAQEKPSRECDVVRNIRPKAEFAEGGLSLYLVFSK